MSDGKIDENISTQSLVQNGDKEDEETVSDGEIVDDDEPEEQKLSAINFLQRKVTKNFRTRQENSESEEESEKKKCITDGELKELKAHIATGDQMLDKSALESFRKKIIDELGRKDELANNRKNANFARNPKSDSNRRYSAPVRPLPQRDGFRRNNFDHSRRNNNFRGGGSRNFFNRNQENGATRATGDTIRIRGITRPIFFPKNIIKFTKTSPSISFSENPRHQTLDSREKVQPIAKSNENNKPEGDKKKKSEKSTKESKETLKKSSKKEEEREKASKKEQLDSNEKNLATKESSSPAYSEIDHKEKHEEKHEEKHLESKEKTPVMLSPKSLELPSDMKDVIMQEEPEKRSPSKSPIIRPKSPKRVEKPKVNIFLEDSDEVDEFESVIVTSTEVKSRWMSPEMEEKDEKIPQIVPAPIVEHQNLASNVPLVADSPESSPILTESLTNNLFKLSSVTIERSPTPSPPPKPTLVKNVCSFLSDIASGNIFSGLGLGNGLYEDDNFEDNNESSISGLNLDDYKVEKDIKQPDQERFDICKFDGDNIMEPDTTADKIVEKAPEKLFLSDDDSDSSDSDTSSSSDSDSDDTTSESEESSEESSDDDVPSFTRGFGRFDASSMPMVMQIKSTTAAVTTTTSTVTVSRFQSQQSVIKPPGLVTSITKPMLYTPPSPMPTISTPFSVSAAPNLFPIPFKIYSLREASNCQMIFPSVGTPVSTQPPKPTIVESPTTEKKKKPSDKDKREKERMNSRSLSRERDKKRPKDDRRKSPQRRRSPSPKKRHSDDRGRQTDDRKDSRRRDPSPKHNSTRSSHGSRHSPARRSRKSRSRTPHRVRSPLARPRTPPRPRTPTKTRRSPPARRSVSRSPPSKYRRSSSPGSRRFRSPSPAYRRSPRRRFSRSPNRNRRTPSPEYRYERRSFSPSFRNKLDSPVGYKPDSTISDTELERQQQYMQEEFYLAQWNNPPSTSPKRPNLDDRIHRMLSDSPTHSTTSNNIPHGYQPEGYPYPVHDNQSGMFYPDVYHVNSNHMPPPHHQQQPLRFPIHTVGHHGSYEEFNNFSSPRNFVNNSNLVEITQQKRERQRLGSSQVAVQVGNVLEIVPSNRVLTSTTEVSKDDKSKMLSPSEAKQQLEKRAQMKLKRKADRERKRLAKLARKEKMRQEIQRYLDAGVTADHSDDENLIPLRSVNIGASADRSIMKKSKGETRNEKKVLFRDGILPGESTSEEDGNENGTDFIAKQRRKKFRRKRLLQLIRSQTVNGTTITTSGAKVIDLELEKAPPPPPPADSSPPAHLKQPRLKKITAEMFAAFPVNPEPLYYYIQKIQQANGFNHAAPPPRPSDRFNYYRKQPPPSVPQSPAYSQQQQRGSITKPVGSVSSLDPRINQRTAEKSFA